MRLPALAIPVVLLSLATDDVCGQGYRGPGPVCQPGFDSRPKPPTYHGPRDIMRPRTTLTAKKPTDTLPQPAPGGRTLPTSPGAPNPIARLNPLGPASGGYGFDLQVSRSSWRFWWDHNRERFLQLRRHLDTVRSTTGSDEFFLGVISDHPCDVVSASHESIVEAVYPTLMKILSQREKRLSGEINAALMALGKLGSHPVDSTRMISSYLDYDDLGVQETATISLGILAHRAAIPTLLELVRDTEKGRVLVAERRVPLRTRALAIYALGLMGHALAGEDLRLMRLQIGDLLVKQLREDRSAVQDIRVASVIALGLLPFEKEECNKKIFPALEELLRDSESPNQRFVRAHVPSSIARLGGKRYVPLFLQMLGDRKENALVRQSLVLALGELVDRGDANAERTVELLIRLGKEARSTAERGFTGIALGQIGSSEALGYLARSVLKGTHLFRPWAALGLGIHGFELGPTEALDPALPEALHKAMERNADPDLREAFALALGLMHYLPSEGLLLRELQAAGTELHKGNVGIGLGLMQADEAADPVYRELVNSMRKPDQLDLLSLALGMLRGRDTTLHLHEFIAQHPTAAMYKTVGRALGRLRDARSLKLLTALVHDDHLAGEARAYAIVALGMMGNKEDWPWNAKIAANLNYLAAVATLTCDGDGVLDI